MVSSSDPDAAPSLGRRLARVFSESERVAPGGATGVAVMVLSVLGSCAVACLALFGKVTEHEQIAWFLLFLFPVCFLCTTAYKGVKRLTAIDYLFAVVASALGAWFILNEPRYAVWMPSFSEITLYDQIAGVAIVALSVELCRRTVGPGLTVVVALILVYVVFGDALAGSFRHPGIEFTYFIQLQTILQDGIFGSPLYVTASYAFLFVLFGNFFVASGGGQLFFDVAAAATGRLSGGPAKACVLSSGLYGSISGSPVADVATTGPISIPIMRSIGIPAARAGAIEAAASTGGSILPPVMGAVAFIMADFTGIPYHKICAYAILPALGYYLGVYTLVHFEARRLDLGRVPEDQIVGLKIALGRNWPSLVPIGVLIWLLATGYSAAYVAAGSTLAAIVASWARPNTAIGPRRFVEACTETCIAMVPLIGAVAAAGLFIGCIELTGLSGKFTLLLFQLSGGELVPSMILAAVVLILLGMGMPTTGVYIMGVALLVPVFVSKFGMPVMETHLFMLFFSCMSAITPPVAVAAFAAGAIAKASPMKIGPYACQLAVGGFVLPFFFLFNRGIVLQGSLFDIVSDTIIGYLVVLSAAVAIYGWVVKYRLNVFWRLLFAAITVGMIYPLAPLQYGLAATAVALFLFMRTRSGDVVAVRARPAA